MCQFERYIGIDYSGAKTPEASLPGLRVFMAEGSDRAHEVPPPPSARKYWTRRGLTQGLEERLKESVPTIIGIDHAFSFPKSYFEAHSLPFCWRNFLDDYCDHWPTDREGIRVRDLWKRKDSTAQARRGKNSWRRLTEKDNPAKPVFQFGVQGEVASSTHAGLPFLRALKNALPNVHFWPFDGWEVERGKSCLIEAYPRLYLSNYLNDYDVKNSFTLDQRDAYVTAMWMRDADQKGHLRRALNPKLPDEVRKTATYEGWILGAEWPRGGGTDSRDAEKPRGPEAKEKVAECEATRPGHINKNGQISVRNTGILRGYEKQKIYQIACSKCGLNYGTSEYEILKCKCPICGGR